MSWFIVEDFPEPVKPMKIFILA